MKRLTALLLTFLLFSSCTAQKTPTNATVAHTQPPTTPTEAPTENPYAPNGDENTFLLPALPDIGEYQADELNRWYEGAMPELIPSSEYGKLHPYLGDVKEFYYNSPIYPEGYSSKRLYYGLCTEDGTLVTDPVYTGITYHDGCYLLVTEYADRRASVHSRAYIAAEDGSAITLIHDGVGVPQYYAPDVYGVVNKNDPSLTPSPRFYLHANGTRYDTDIHGLPEYEHGFLLFREYKNGLSDDRIILDKELHPIGDYIYREAGAEGEVIAYNDDGFVILDASGNVRYSTDKILFYDGTYMIKTDEKELTFLDEDMSAEKTVTYPTEIYNVFCGYVKGRDWYYTFSGEKTEYFRIEQAGGVYLFRSDSGTLIKDGDAEFFMDGKKVKRAVIYEHAVAVRFEDGYTPYLYDRESGKLIDELNSFDENGYMLPGESDYSYTVPTEGEYVFRAQNGVFTTVTADGKVLVKLHSDTE